MWGLRRITLTLVILVMIFGGCAGKHVACLEIITGEPEELLTRLPVEPGLPFTLEFINSIYLAPVRETLVYCPPEGVSIIMVESPSDGVFEYYGLETNGTGKVLMRRKVGNIRLKSHNYANHRLTVGSRVLQLKDLVPNGEPVMVRIRAGSHCGM